MSSVHPSSDFVKVWKCVLWRYEELAQDDKSS
jgi:hypothetical protein